LGVLHKCLHCLWVKTKNASHQPGENEELKKIFFCIQTSKDEIPRRGSILLERYSLKNFGRRNFRLLRVQRGRGWPRGPLGPPEHSGPCGRRNYDNSGKNVQKIEIFFLYNEIDYIKNWFCKNIWLITIQDYVYYLPSWFNSHFWYPYTWLSLVGIVTFK